MTRHILMGASVLAILAAFPAFAANDTHTSTSAEVKAETKTEMQKAGDAIEKRADKAGAAVKDTYKDIKAYFTEDDDVKRVTSISVLNKDTAKGMIGKKIENTAGKKIGDVHDIIIDKDGDAETVVIEDGGFLGLGGKLVAFDYEVIQGINADNNVVAPLSKATIDKAKGFDYEVKSGDTKVSTLPATSYSVEKLLKANVVGPDNEKLATVDNVSFEGNDAEYLIISFDKILGVGGEKAAIELDAVKVAKLDDGYTVQLTAAQAAEFKNLKATN